MRKLRRVVLLSFSSLALAALAPRFAGACADPLPAGIGAKIEEIPGGFPTGGFRVSIFGGTAFGSVGTETCGCAFAVPIKLINGSGCNLTDVQIIEPVSNAFSGFSPDLIAESSFLSLFQTSPALTGVDLNQYSLTAFTTALSGAVAQGASLTIQLDYTDCDNMTSTKAAKLAKSLFKNSGIIGTGPITNLHTVDQSDPSHVGVSIVRSKPGCQKSKLNCVAKKCNDLLTCHSKAEKAGVAVSPACLQKGQDKFDGGALPEKGCFKKVENKNGCLTVGNTAPVEAQVDAFVDDIVTDLDPSYPAATQSACAALKKLCTAKKVKAILACYGKAENAGVPVDPACIAKAVAKFDACFSKAESAADCFLTGDNAAIEAKVDTFINAILCAIDPSTCP
jgi:hypothetical protein